MTPLRVRELSADDGMTMAMWQRPGPWAPHDPAVTLAPDEGFWAVVDADDALVGYCCLGDAARPPGLAARVDRLDVAIGLRPELTGRGLGAPLGRVAVDYATSVANGRRLRCAVADWNTRNLRVAEAAGFAVAGEHRVEDRRYLLLELA